MATATFASPITGTLQTYELSSFLQLADGAVIFDTDAARNQLNNEFYAQGVDTVCNQVKYIASSTATWIQVDNWVPVSTASLNKSGLPTTTLEPVSAIVVAILAILKIIIPLIVAGIVIVGITWVAGNIYMTAAYPRIYYTMPDPVTGKINGPWTREEVFSWNSAKYPNLWIDPTTTIGLDPTKPDFDEKRTFIINNTPAGWGQPFGGDILGGLMPIILIIGGIIVAVVALPPLIRWVASRGKE